MTPRYGIEAGRTVLAPYGPRVSTTINGRKTKRKKFLPGVVIGTDDTIIDKKHQWLVLINLGNGNEIIDSFSSKQLRIKKDADLMTFDESDKENSDQNITFANRASISIQETHFISNNHVLLPDTTVRRVVAPLGYDPPLHSREQINHPDTEDSTDPEAIRLAQLNDDVSTSWSNSSQSTQYEQYIADINNEQEYQRTNSSNNDSDIDDSFSEEDDIVLTEEDICHYQIDQQRALHEINSRAVEEWSVEKGCQYVWKCIKNKNDPDFFLHDKSHNNVGMSNFDFSLFADEKLRCFKICSSNRAKRKVTRDYHESLPYLLLVRNLWPGDWKFQLEQLNNAIRKNNTRIFEKSRRVRPVSQHEFWILLESLSLLLLLVREEKMDCFPSDKNLMSFALAALLI
jgi:hypothetical protein